MTLAQAGGVALDTFIPGDGRVIIQHRLLLLPAGAVFSAASAGRGLDGVPGTPGSGRPQPARRPTRR